MIRIPTRLQGPTDTGQGGWTSARFVQDIQSTFEAPFEAGETSDLTVAIRSPIPLDVDLETRVDGDGWVLVNPAVEESDAILRAQAWDPVYARTSAVSVAAAREASALFPLDAQTHPVPLCFSCGLHPESMAVHSGPLGDGRFATDWRVPGWAADEDGAVDDAVLWAAIDCAAAWYVGCTAVESYRAAFTVQLAVEILHPLSVDEEYSLVSWAGEFDDSWDGRKRGAASAAFDSSGTLVGQAHSFWVSAPTT